MKNQLLHQVIHIPLSSLAYPAERTPERLSLEYPSQLQELASGGYPKTTPNKLDRMSRIAETLTRKLSLGAKTVKIGGVWRIFKYNFSLVGGEKMLKASQCYLSTTAGPIAGILFISTEKVAFCSEKSIELSSPTEKVIRIPYKVSIPIKKMLRANESQNLKRPTRADEDELSDATELALLYHETEEKRKRGVKKSLLTTSHYFGHNCGFGNPNRFQIFSEESSRRDA